MIGTLVNVVVAVTVEENQTLSLGLAVFCISSRKTESTSSIGVGQEEESIDQPTRV